MNDRTCPRCGSDVLYGHLDGWPDVTLSRTPITRESALARLSAGLGVAACQRSRIGMEIRAQFWHALLGDEWVRLIDHDCLEWK